MLMLAIEYIVTNVTYVWPHPSFSPQSHRQYNERTMIFYDTSLGEMEERPDIDSIIYELTSCGFVYISMCL